MFKTLKKKQLEGKIVMIHISKMFLKFSNHFFLFVFTTDDVDVDAIVAAAQQATAAQYEQQYFYFWN